MIATGNKVAGTYFGIPYTGTVESTRPHSMRHDVQVTFIELDTPIVVYGDERHRIAIEADCMTGDPAIGFGTKCSIKPLGTLATG